jgi:drug/metabolite transporter (DMT)-like permease
MLALIIAIACGTCFGLVLRHTQRLGHDQFAIMTINHFAAFAGAFVLAGSSLRPSPSTLLISSIAGVLFVAAYVVLLHSMDLKGVGIAAAISRLAVLIPVVATVFIWHERPQLLEGAGALLALSAMPLLSLDGNDRALTRRQVPLLLALFLGQGLCLLTSKWFHSTGLQAERPLYFALVFGIAGIASVACWLIWSRRCGWREVAFGIPMGLMNVANAMCLVIALDTLSGSVVFPVFAAVTLSLTTGAAAWLWKEIPGPRGRWGIAVATAAVVLINLHV